MSEGIIIFGANGSGKSTLGRELAHILNYKHMDIEDYCFLPSEIPYTLKRTREDCLSLMLTDIKQYRSFVLSAVTGDFGEEITSMYTLAIHLTAPPALRLERIKQRTYAQYGKRALKGGDMYQQTQDFLSFAASRPLSPIDQWSQTLTCPILQIDTTSPLQQILTQITTQCPLIGPSFKRQI